MTISNNSIKMFKALSFFLKIISNPYFGLCISLLLILPSLYVILGDYTVLRKEYIFLAIGIPVYVKSLNKIFENILNSN